MPLITSEPLPARLLRVFTGPDPAFGVGGIATPSTDATANESLVAAPGAVYVAQVVHAAGSRVGRLDDAGRVDGSSADAGRATVPFRAATLAYDKHGDRLYGVGQDDDGTLVRVFRLTPAGRLDTSFGTGGVATYALGADVALGERESRSASVETVDVLRDGGVMIGLKTIDTVDDEPFSENDPGIQSDTAESQVMLVRFRRDGRRDRSFGRRGVRVIAAGRQDHFSDSEVRATTGDEPTLHAVTTLADGGFRASLTRATLDVTTLPGRAQSNLYAIEQTTVNAAGRITTGVRRKLFGAADNSGFAITGLLDREGDVVLVGRLNGENRRFDLRSGTVTSTPMTIREDFGIQRLFDDHRGGFFAVGTFASSAASQPGIAHLRADGILNRRWGEGGVAYLDDDFSVAGVGPGGRLLTSADAHASLPARVGRVDGSAAAAS